MNEINEADYILDYEVHGVWADFPPGSALSKKQIKRVLAHAVRSGVLTRTVKGDLALAAYKHPFSYATLGVGVLLGFAAAIAFYRSIY